MKSIFKSINLLLLLLLVGVMQAQTNATIKLATGKNKVSFMSQGVKVIGDLFLPSNFDPSKKYAAILFDGPSSGLKDQVVGVYAQKMSDSGFVSLAYDHRFYGESDGLPRQFEAPSKKMEDNKSAMDYLSHLSFIDKNKIAGIGICSGGGIMSKSVAEDSRFKTYIGIAGYYNDTAAFKGNAYISSKIVEGKAARLKFETSGEVEYIPAIWSDPNEKKAIMSGNEPSNEPFAYYGTKRGYSPYYINRMAIQSYEDMLRFDVLSKASKIIVPSLVIHGTTDLYCSVSGAQKFYDQLTAPKELFWITTTNHIDLYDQAIYVNKAIVKSVAWLKANLK
jgi:uncharacterized protein